MLRRLLYWAITLMPAALALGFFLLLATAVVVIHVSKDAEAFADSPPFLQQLARDVYQRHRAIWQAQRECILFDEELFYLPRPGRCQFENLEFKTTQSFDARGHRRSAPPWGGDGRAARGRVIVLGDSQAMGWGVRDEETFSSRLATEYGFEVHNLGVASYGTARELLRLRREFTIRRGDVVFIQYHLNDFTENQSFLEHKGMIPRTPNDLQRLTHHSQAYSPFRVAASVVFILKGRVIRRLSLHEQSADDPAQRQAEVFLAVLQHFPELREARVVVCEIGSFGQASAFPEELRHRAGGAVFVMQPTWGSKDFYRLDDHLTADGHRRLAGMIATLLATSVPN